MKQSHLLRQKTSPLLVAAVVFVLSILFAGTTLAFVITKDKNMAPSPKPAIVKRVPSFTQEALLVETNKHRATPLVLDPVLNATAQAKCQDLANRNVLEHGNLNTMAESLDRSKVGENLAAGYENVKQTMDAWVASPAHNQNLVDTAWKRVGFGICKSSTQGTIIVQHFST